MIPTEFLAYLPEPIRNDFAQLHEDVTLLAHKLRIYEKAFLIPENRNVLFQLARTMFSFLEASLTTDITVSLGRLMDPPKTGKDANLSLKHLFDLIEKHGNSPDLLNSVRQRYKNLEHLTIPLTQLRHKRIAHRDLATALNEQGLKLMNALDVIALGKEFLAIINEIEVYFGAPPMPFHAAFVDVDEFVQIVKLGNQAFREQIRVSTLLHMGLDSELHSP